MTKELKNPPTDRRYLGAVLITLVVCFIAISDQLSSSSVDKWVLFTLIVLFLGWLGENVVELIKTLWGRGS